MKEPKDIFDLFKENEDKLNTKPSDRAWNRLEGRLDNHLNNNQPQRAPRLMRTWLSIAGVLLVLVTMISAISLLFKNESPQKMAMLENASQPHFVLEEIGVFSDQNNTSRNIDLYRKQLNRLNTNPILEGDPSKELRVQQQVFKTIKDENLKKSNSATTNTNPKQMAANGTKQMTAAGNSSPIASKEKATMTMNAAPAPMVSEREEVVFMDQVAMDEVTSDNASNNLIASFLWIIGQWESPIYNNNNTNFKKDKKSAVEEKNVEIEIETSSALTKEKINNRSFEEWTETNATTLTGKGFIMTDGIKTATESMQITQIGDALYYILTLNSGVPRPYQMKSFSATEIVFENLELSFPNQVILKLDHTNGVFTTLFKHNSPMQLDEELQQFFGQRNEISSEQIKRAMTKRQ